MAEVCVTFFRAERSGTTLDTQAINGEDAKSQIMTSSDTAASTTITAGAGQEYALVSCINGCVAVKSGAEPTATVATGAIADYSSILLKVKVGDKISVIDAV